MKALPQINMQLFSTNSDVHCIVHVGYVSLVDYLLWAIVSRTDSESIDDIINTMGVTEFSLW